VCCEPPSAPHSLGCGLSDGSCPPLFTAGGHPPSEVSNDTAKRRLNNFINEVTRKRDSLIREPPKQPPAKPVLPRRSRRLAAQSLSRVPAFKHGEVLIMQHIGFINGPSAPSASRLATYDKLFEGDLTADDAEALDELFPAIRPRRRKATS
jgi:hypothetical protein